MGKKLDLVGQVFGRLTVVSKADRSNSRKVLWNCECSCGNSKVVRGCSLKSGDTQSCGCLNAERAKGLHTTHGLHKHPLYKVFIGMIDRCFNPKSTHYEDYGGRGITICDRWKDSLGNFIEDVAVGYGKGLHLDRINNDGNYTPDNVRWVTPQQNNMNRGGAKNSTSKYKGVSWNKATTKWRADIRKDGKLHYLGLFTDETEAALAYNEKAKELFGEYANLNKTGGV